MVLLAALPKDLMVWLASPEAKFLNGKTIINTWDVEELKASASKIQESLVFSIGMKGFPDVVPF